MLRNALIDGVLDQREQSGKVQSIEFMLLDLSYGVNGLGEDLLTTTLQLAMTYEIDNDLVSTVLNSLSTRGWRNLHGWRLKITNGAVMWEQEEDVQ